MDQRVDAALAFMIANLHRKITALEIAQSVRLSTSHLRHIFKDETGTSLTRYLRELRLKRAKQLLETTFLTVKEVCSAVGIEGVSHFVRDFEKVYRMTPARYAARRRRVTDRRE
jgi:transcriptional regulator GlxA family with amidase domain